ASPRATIATLLGGRAMNREPHWTRRSVLKTAGAGLLGTLTVSSLQAQELHKAKGNIKQSVCRWCYAKIVLPKLAEEAAKMGYKSVELLTLDEIKEVQAFGLTCAMIRCASITEGLNRRENHDRIEKELRRNIEFAAAQGMPNVICMSGNRKGMP